MVMTEQTKKYPFHNPIIPVREIESLLNGAWYDFENKPHIYVMNNGLSPLRQQINNYDIINIVNGSPAQELTPIGNWVYGDYLWRVVLHIYTKQSRDRLWEINHNVMNICFEHLHNNKLKVSEDYFSAEGKRETEYKTLYNDAIQRITYKQFNEIDDSAFNFWHGKIDIELEAKAIQIRPSVFYDGG